MRISFPMLLSVGVSMLAAAACGGGDEQTFSASTTSSTSTGGTGGTGTGGAATTSTGTGGAATTSTGSGGQGGTGGGSVGAVVDNCGNSDCAIENGQVCCFNPNAMPPDPQLECTAGGTCEVTITCNGPEDCAGAEVCCHTGAVAACDAACSGNIFCHTAADCPDPGTDQCVQVMGGFISVCMTPP